MGSTVARCRSHKDKGLLFVPKEGEGKDKKKFVFFVVVFLI